VCVVLCTSACLFVYLFLVLRSCVVMCLVVFCTPRGSTHMCCSVRGVLCWLRSVDQATRSTQPVRFVGFLVLCICVV